VKRTLWHILTAAVAAVLPGLAGPTVADVTPAPVPEAVKPAPEAVQVRRPEVRHDERVLDEHDDDPAPFAAAPAVATAASSAAFEDATRAIAAPRSAPEVAPLARRSLGRPRTRAPDALA
jgi:hypothetical protein